MKWSVFTCYVKFSFLKFDFERKKTATLCDGLKDADPFLLYAIINISNNNYTILENPQFESRKNRQHTLY